MYLSGDFAVSVKLVESECPLLSVILLHRHGTLQLLKQHSTLLLLTCSTCVCACSLWPSFQRVSNKHPVQCRHSLQTGDVSLAVQEIDCPSSLSSPPHSSCLSSLGVKPLQQHTNTHKDKRESLKMEMLCAVIT